MPSNRRTSHLVILACVGGCFCLFQWAGVRQSRQHFLDDALSAAIEEVVAENSTLTNPMLLDGVLSVLEDFDQDEADQIQRESDMGALKRPGAPSLADRRNIRLAFVGDSISRYMYLALAAYLKDGEWYPDGMERSLLIERTFIRKGGWPGYLNFSNYYLRPYESCDCIRPGRGREGSHTFVEDRFYMDPDRNNYVYYIQKLGLLPAQGYLDFKDMNDTSREGVWWDDTKPANMTWRADWPTVIRKLKDLPEPPEYVIFNAGLWEHELADPGVMESIVEAFRETGFKSIYRTTTASTHDTKATYLAAHQHEKEYCAAMDACMNMTYTIDLPREENYWDHVHFYAHRNQHFNEDLFEVIGQVAQQ